MDRLVSTPTVSPAEQNADKQGLETDIAAGRRATLVVNARSREGQRHFDRACELLSNAGFTLDAAHAVKDPGQLDTIVCEAIAVGAGLVAVGGGDGTLSSISRHFIGSTAVLGLLPLGTANCFARSLGVPMDLGGAIDVLATGHVAKIDLGRIGEHYFTNAAAIGLPASIGETIPHALKAVLGRVGYFAWAMWCLARLRPFECTLTTGGGPRTFHALEVRISNGPYLGGLEVAPEASVESERLVVQIVTGRSILPLVRSWALSAFGRPGGDAIVSVRIARAWIETDPPMSVSIDGEVLTKTPIEISVARHVLKVIVPADRTDLQ